MNKNVLILCTGNSCRSIIAEALINSQLENVIAYSSGVSPSGRVNPNAKKVLEAHNEWNSNYHSKTLDTVNNINFDLVVTVCDNAKETCPIFPKPTLTIHEGFKDPDGEEYKAFETTYSEIKSILLPRVKTIFSKDEEASKDKSMQKNVFKTTEGVKINFTGAVKKQQIMQMVENCATGSCACMSDETKKKMTNMEVEGKDGNIELKLTGEISKEEIEAALSRSTVLNKSKN